MTAAIIQIRDYQQPKDIQWRYEEWTHEAVNLVLMPSTHDTAPSEYVAPSDDCA